MRLVHTAAIVLFGLLICSCTSLIMSASDGNVKGVKAALARGISIESRDQNGSTALILAASAGHADVVECLCFHGANVNARTHSGVTALHHAAYYNLLDVAKVLVKFKADKTIRDQYGYTPLYYADQYEYTRMMALLSDERPKYAISAQFDSQEWHYCEGIGTCGLVGLAFLMTRDGEEKTCAGQNVYIMPYNNYTKEILDVKKTGTHSGFSNTDPRLRKHIRITTCDADGDFEFNDLPDGWWIISTRVEWQVAVGSVMEKHGGQLMKPVDIKDGSTKKIYLTSDDRVF